MDPSVLIETAVKVKQKAYCPYSKFHVGAALMAEDGTIFSGCNVENCSYGGAICAERTAFVKAVSEGHHRFLAIAITSDSKEYVLPCGICRQFMAEFGLDLSIYIARPDGAFKQFNLRQLLPEAFVPSSLPDRGE